MGEYVATALDMRERQGAMPFVVRENATGEIVGCTRYFNVDATNRRLEIGHTWYARRVQRTALNTECKLLLLGHAFETLHCIAVEFRTHWFNHASRTAIARLGAKQDGVLRNHQLMPDGAQARHRRVQHHRRRVAGGEAAPAIPAGASRRHASVCGVRSSNLPKGRITQCRIRMDPSCRLGRNFLDRRVRCPRATRSATGLEGRRHLDRGDHGLRLRVRAAAMRFAW